MGEIFGLGAASNTHSRRSTVVSNYPRPCRDGPVRVHFPAATSPDPKRFDHPRRRSSSAGGRAPRLPAAEHFRNFARVNLDG